MFKSLKYGRRHSINFGSVGTNWHKKAEIAKQLSRYRPWSIQHAVEVQGGRANLYSHMTSIVNASKSPTEKNFFEAWWNLSPQDDRPMLFPQVSGHTSGKFWLNSPTRVVPIHFDFGLVNVVRRTKILIECDSRRHHSSDDRYQDDRDRQNIAEKEGWSVRRFTYEDVKGRIDQCFTNLQDDIFY
jgi:hypothetical protein